MKNTDPEKTSTNELPIAPDWVSNSNTPSDGLDLKSLLSLGTNLYIQHTNWFLRHEELTIKNFVVLITAESALSGFIFSVNEVNVLFYWIAVVILILLILISPLLAIYGIRSCERSFGASLEHVMLNSKIIWAMGFATSIRLENPNLENCPALKDESLYIPRHLNSDNSLYKTTQEFVDYHLKRKHNTLFHARLKIRFFCFFGMLLGIISSTFILLGKIFPT